MNITSKDILNYEIDKKSFYKKRNLTVDSVITSEFCEYEEKKYGESLTLIYSKMYEIEKGKSMLMFELKYLVVWTLLFVGFKLNNANDTLNLLLNIVYMVNIIMIFLKTISNKYIKSYILYLFAKIIYLK